MPVKQGCCSVPAGKIYIGEWAGGLQAALPSGGVITPQTSLVRNGYLGLTGDSAINYSFNEETLPNQDTPAGGPGCSFRDLNDATLDVQVQCNDANVGVLAMLGMLRETAAGAVTAEKHSVIKNATSVVSGASATFVGTNGIIDTSVAVTVTNLAATVTYVNGTDYTVSGGGIIIPASSGIPNDVGPNYTGNILINYTRVDSQRVDGLVTLPKTMSLYFDGFDKASGAIRQGTVYKVQGSAESVPIKSKAIVQIAFKFKLYADERIPANAANPTSQYFHFTNS